MPSKFQRKKEDIIRQLTVPDSDYTDLSPKGSVDEGIRKLVDNINQCDAYVTTSSCAGRIAVFLEGGGIDLTSNDIPSDSAASTTRSGKGGGRWLYVSHDPIDETSIREPSQLYTLLGLQSMPISVPSSEQATRFVRFKFEPMILHVLTSELQHAQHVYSAAMSAGLRESGIGGTIYSKTTQQANGAEDESLPMVAIRTTGLAFDSIVAYQDSHGIIHPMVSEEYLRILVRIANDRFKINAERKERFATALFKAPSTDDTWEPPDVRRERKRAEGLRRRAQLAQTEVAEEAKSSEAKDADEYESLSTNMLEKVE